MNELAAFITTFVDHVYGLWQGGGGVRRRRQGAFGNARRVPIGFTKPTKRKMNWTSRGCFDLNDGATLGGGMHLASYE